MPPQQEIMDDNEEIDLEVNREMSTHRLLRFLKTSFLQSEYDQVESILLEREEELRLENEVLIDVLQRQRDQMDDKNAEIEKLNAQLEELTRTNAELHRWKSEHQSQPKVKEEPEVLKEALVDKLNTESAKLQADLQISESKIQKLEQEMEVLKKENEKLGQAMDTLKNDHELLLEKRGAELLDRMRVDVLAKEKDAEIQQLQEELQLWKARHELRSGVPRLGGDPHMLPNMFESRDCLRVDKPTRSSAAAANKKGDVKPEPVSPPVSPQQNQGCPSFEISDSDNDCDPTRGVIGHEIVLQESMKGPHLGQINAEKERIELKRKRESQNNMFFDSDSSSSSSEDDSENDSSTNKLWKNMSEMTKAIKDRPRVAMEAVCALYRQHMSSRKSIGGSSSSQIRGFRESYVLSGTNLAKFLIDGDPDGKLKKSAEELHKYGPGALLECKRIAHAHESQLFEIYKKNEDPFFP